MSAHNRCTSSLFPLQCTHQIISTLWKLIGVVLKGVRLRKQLIVKCVHCSGKRAGETEAGATEATEAAEEGEGENQWMSSRISIFVEESG